MCANYMCVLIYISIFIGNAPAAAQNTDTLITESNLVYYLGLIEQKANQILSKYANVRQYLIQASQTNNSMLSHGNNSMNKSQSDATLQNSKSIVAILGTGPKIAMGQDLIHVNPPKLEEYQSDDEDNMDDDAEMRPLTRDELKLR